MVFTVDRLCLVLIYAITACISLYAALLYRKASIQMKKTKMIKSVYYFLSAFFFSNVWFTLVIIARCYEWELYNHMTTSFMWGLPKLILLASLIYFIYASLSPPDNACKELNKAHKNYHSSK